MHLTRPKTLLIATATAMLTLNGCITESTDSTIGGSTPPTQKEVTLSWDAPTTRTDGSCLGNDLSGFKVKYRAESSGDSNDEALAMNDGALSCNQTAYDSACGAIVYSCSYTLADLSPGTWHFAVQAYDGTNIFSPESESVTMTVR